MEEEEKVSNKWKNNSVNLSCTFPRQPGKESQAPARSLGQRAAVHGNQKDKSLPAGNLLS